MGPLFYTLHMRCLKALLALPSKYTITVSTVAASVQGTISPNHCRGAPSPHPCLPTKGH